MTPTKPLTIIGLTGHAGAGKDTVASLLLEQHDSNGATIAFADALRREVCKAFRVAMPLLTRRDTKETPSPWLALCNCGHPPFVRRMVEHYASGTRDGGIEGETLDLFAPRSARQIMQWWGTEYRRHTSPGHWLNAMQDRIAFEQDEHDLIVITDVRFADEAQLIRDAGGQIWQVTRPGFGDGPAKHTSETAGSEFAPTVVIDNSGDLSALAERVAEALEAQP